MRLDEQSVKRLRHKNSCSCSAQSKKVRN